MEPIRMFLRVLAVITGIEALVMTFFWLFDIRGLWAIAIDSALLAVLSTPLVYIWVVKPAIREKLLREMEPKFRQMLEAAPDAMVIATRGGHIITFVNAQTEKLFGYRKEELLGQPVEILVPERFRESHVRHRTRYGPTPNPVRMGERRELYGRRKDGTEFPADIMLGPIEADGELSVMSIVQDITERKRLEQELLGRVRQQETVARLGLLALSGADLNTVMGDAVRQVCQTLEVEFSKVLEVLPDGKELLLRAGVGWKEGSVGHATVGAGLDSQAGYTLVTSEPVILEDLRRETRFTGPPLLRDHGVISGMSVTIKGRNSPFGVLSAHTRRPRKFDRDDAHFLESVANVLANIVEKNVQMADLKYQATHDALTGLPNRAMLHDLVLQAIRTTQHQGKSLALLLMDIDRFKEINDTLGPRRGDLLLQQIGPRLSSVLHEGDSIARLGGDEFAVLLPLAESQHATRIADKIMKVMEPPFEVEGLPIAVEVSIGIVVSPDHGSTVELLMQRADIAMYTTKQTGGYTVYDTRHDRYSPRRLALMGELRYAIEHDALVLSYQPKISLKTGRAIGMEALVRWKHPVQGMIPPDQFIGAAEQTGLIKPLTLWVFKEAQRQCLTWYGAGLGIPVSINLSARNLLDPHLPDQLSELMRACGGAPDRLELEITESAIMTDTVRALDAIQRLRALGIRFAIDDFGIGYSSLAYLQQLPVDSIKIDKSFVSRMAQNPNDAIIVRSTIDLAHNLGLTVVAEGVENKTIWDLLVAQGCDIAQGYYISKPIPGDELPRWLRESPFGM